MTGTPTPGNDLIIGTAARDIIDARLGNDTVNGLGGNDQLSGNHGNDRLFGSIGDDFLFGGDQQDLLAGGEGNDTLDGGNGVADAADYASSTSAVVVNLSVAGQQNTKGGGLDTLIAIENLSGTDFDDGLSGNGLANRLSGKGGKDTLAGNAGRDVLIGGGGNDSLFGGSGDDRLNGGVGDDLLNGGAGADDLAEYIDAQLGVTVDLAQIVAQNTKGAGNDRITGVEGVQGSLFDDVLSGNNAKNQLLGELGNDALTGRGGNDVLNGHAGGDTLAGGSGNDVLLGQGGLDEMTGGAGADAFRFLTAQDSPSRVQDVIVDFSHAQGDVIDLSAVFPDELLYIGFNHFSALLAGQVRIVRVNAHLQRVEVDLDGLRGANMAIDVQVDAALQFADFIL